MPSPFDPAQLSALQIKGLLARKSPARFAEIASRGKWKSYRHHEYLNQRLLDLAAGRTKRLIITLPPRHGKSQLCSRYFPAWFLGNNPDKEIILCSYEAGFAAGWGGKARDLLQEFGPDFFGVCVKDDTSAKNNWGIIGHEGSMVTAGVGGPVTGRGAAVLIVDDPVKNAEQAASPTYRERAWDWWQSTAFTRIDPDGAALVLQTRWNEDDLAGRLIASNKDEDADGSEERWEVVNLPAIAEDDDALGRAPGEALWPERWPVEKLDRRKRKVGIMVWSALFQQRPTPGEGGKFQKNWIRNYTREGEFYRLVTGNESDRVVRIEDCWRIITADIAGTEKKAKVKKSDPDWTVFSCWDVTPTGDLILADVYRDRKGEPEIVRGSLRFIREQDPDKTFIEKNGIGSGIVNTLKEKGVAVTPVNVKTSKVIRAQKAMLRMQAGTVYFPSHHPSMDELILELIHFPNAAHDDFVDTVSLAADRVQKEFGAVFDDEDTSAAKKTADKYAELELVGVGGAVEVATGAPPEDIDAWLNGQ